MSATPDPYGYSSPSPWWENKFSGTSGGVKLSLVTDRRSEKPPFWEPRPTDTPASSAVTAPPSFSTSTPNPTATVTSPAASTRPLESVRKALAHKDQHKQHKQHASVDGDSNSTSSSKDAKPSYARQWRHRDAQSTPGTPTSTSTGTGAHHHPHSQSYAHLRGRGRGGWRRGREPDEGHLHLDARAQEFVPGRVPRAPRPVEEVDLNEYIRAGSGAGSETMGSSRVSVFGSRSRSPSEEEEEREARSTERDRAEAERQWHLQTSWDDEDGAGDEWTGSAPGVVAEEGEGREGTAGEVKNEWEGGVVSESAEVPAPPGLPSFEPPPPLASTPTNEAQIVLPSLPFGLLLERAKMIQEGPRVVYPKDVNPPGAHTTTYDRDFLLQFQAVCTGPPISVPCIPSFWHSILAPYDSRPAPVRTKEKWVQASIADDHAHDTHLKNRQGERRTVDTGVETETNQPSTDATTRIVDVVYNRLVPDYRERQSSLGGSHSSFGELTCGATPTREENLNVFEYEVQEAQRERLEARVEYLAAEVKVLRLELARIRKVVG